MLSSPGRGAGSDGWVGALQPREELGAIPKLCSSQCPKIWAQPCCSPVKGLVAAILTSLCSHRAPVAPTEHSPGGISASWGAQSTTRLPQPFLQPSACSSRKRNLPVPARWAGAGERQICFSWGHSGSEREKKMRVGKGTDWIWD